MMISIGCGGLGLAPVGVVLGDTAGRNEQAVVSLDRAVGLVRASVDGQVISAETVRRSGRSVHRVRILTHSGRVRDVYVDVSTGVILGR